MPQQKIDTLLHCILASHFCPSFVLSSEVPHILHYATMLSPLKL